jgi:hypothetical protein
MNEITASRTLVKSPPELWAECSDAESLARHLAEFGEISITKLEPETAVAWEGEEFSGTVRLEPSGWGTKVVITALSAAGEAASSAAPAPAAALAPEAVPQLEPEPESMPEPELSGDPDPWPETDPATEADSAPAPRRGLVARLLGRLGRSPAPAPNPPAPQATTQPEPEPAPGPEPERPSELAQPSEPEQPSESEQHLHTALESLGQAHRRPFSRG